MAKSPKWLIDEYFHNTVASDFLQSFLGEPLGVGAFRTVFACETDPSIVVKVETGAGDFCNVLEWENWQACKDKPKIAKWLAPCVSISPNGAILLQKRCNPVRSDELPRKLPIFISTDAKRENWGIYEGRLVCMDYHWLKTAFHMRMRKVLWAESSQKAIL